MGLFVSNGNKKGFNDKAVVGIIEALALASHMNGIWIRVARIAKVHPIFKFRPVLKS